MLCYVMLCYVMLTYCIIMLINFKKESCLLCGHRNASSKMKASNLEHGKTSTMKLTSHE